MNKHTGDLEFFISYAIIFGMVWVLAYYLVKWLLS